MGVPVTVDAFTSWNLVLLRTYFSPASAGEAVWLTIDPDELDAIAPELGGDDGFVEAVRSGPSWPAVQRTGWFFSETGNTAHLVDRALGLVQQRKIRSLRPAGYVDPAMLASEYEGADAPCYLPILAAMVRNCAKQTDSSYYPSLQADLGLAANWGSPQMSQLGEVWQDLESWSVTQEGRFGRFTYQRLGGLVNVGVPRSQVIISRRDTQTLTRVFAQAGVRAGQVPTERLLKDVLSTAREVRFLSSALTEALNKAEFEQPILDRLATLVEDWDGVVFAPSREAALDDDEKLERRAALEVALGLQPGNMLPWEVRWRVPALRDAGTARVASGQARWTAEFAGTELVTTRPGDERQREAARALLAASADEDQRFKVAIATAESSPGSCLGDLTLPERILRSLVPEREAEGAAGQAILLERPLPTSGPAYLLAAASNASRLEQFLQRNPIRHEVCSPDGLPDGWLLVHLPECSALTEALRDELPDGERERSRPSVVRLVGGRVVQRGAGRQYLSFDLPIVELDAPPGTRLEAAGLDLVERHERPDEASPTGAVNALSSLRRFEIQLQGRDAAAFLIRAVHDGTELGKVRLRLAADSGLAVAAGRELALDPRGHTAPDGVGLRGVILSSCDGTHMEDSADSPLHVHLGWPVHAHAVDELRVRAAVRFLDTLGWLGSIALGQARDQLRRLSHPDEPNPYVVLRELRGRGFLEIETNSRGHWVRIHAVPPVLCVLPVTSDRGNVVAALGGTLRLQHWASACSGVDPEVTALRDMDDPSPVLPAIRFAAGSMQALERMAASLGCGIAEHAAGQIADWAAGINDVGGDLRRGGVESLGAGARQVERFIAPRGFFIASEVGMALNPPPGCELFQIEDIETGSHWIYVLGYRDEAGRSRYAFVRDARWGTWLSLAASAAWVRENYGRDDLDPWPLHYEAAARTLWLPKRLNLPVVLERALMLCSGAAPIEERVCSSPADGVVGLSRYGDRKDLGAVSVAYQDYVPTHPGSARWLGYRWVPPHVARRIAAKLGAAIQPLMPTSR